MTENEFFNILMDKLNRFPESELYDIVSYYQDYFSCNLSLGKSQEEIINELGNPHSIAEKIIHDHDKINDHIELFNSIEKVNPAFKTGNCSVLTNSALDNSSEHNNINKIFHTKIDINTVLKAAIIILSIIILLPILAGILFIIFNSCKICLEIIIESFNLALGENLNLYYSIIPSFILDFPKSVLLLFSTGTILISIFFIFVIWYFLKLIFIVLLNLLKKFKENTGDL